MIRWGLAVMLLLLGSAPVQAAGPGTHVLEANAVLDVLVDEDPEWAALAALPFARAYLGFGAMSPDFRSACAEIDFGHQKALSYHLLNLALDEKPEFRLFALGHMCHQGSDNAMEGLSVAAFFSSAPVGIFSLFGEYLDGRGDSEAIIESMGDLVFGDWHGLVDVLFDMWFEDETAQDRAAEVFQWYCQAAAAFLGNDTDCALAQIQLEGKLAQAEGIIGLLDRQAAHDFVELLVSQPLEDIVELAGSGLLTSLLGEQGEPGADFDAEIERMKDSPLTDPGFWTLYGDLAPLGPAFALAQMEHQPPTGAWPIYDKEMVICGNLQSVMRHLPDEYAVTTGLTVDQVLWTKADGQPVSVVTPDVVGQTLIAKVRVFSSLPFSGTVTGTVRRDMPGFDNSGDDALGSVILSLEIDPAMYVTTPRAVLEIPFVADTAGALGVYLELTAGVDPRPWFTTSWDRLWSIEELLFASPIYKDNFGTYGHWPPSLPVETPVEAGASVFVQVVVAPTGPGIAGVELALELSSGGLSMVLPGATTGANGLAPLDWVAPGALTVTTDAGTDYQDQTAVTEVLSGDDQWIFIALHGIPRVHPPGFWDAGECVPLTWDPEPFGGQVAFLTVTPLDPTTGAPLGVSVELSADGDGEICIAPPLPDGTAVAFLAKATYTDGTAGVEGTGGTVILDGSPPTLVVLPVGFDDDPCVEKETTGLSIQAEDPHTALVALAWSVDGGAWVALPLETDETGKVLDAFLPVPDHLGAAIRVRVTNAVGLETASEPVPVPEAAAWCGVPEWGAESSPEPTLDTMDPAEDVLEADVVDGVVDDDPSPGRGGGCGSTDGPAPPLTLFVLAILLGGAFSTGTAPRRRRRRCSARRTR
ncbi:MAG: hypothetical protein ABIK09_19610 [Pseudomonadota bacterium]